jgi:hypothetical protein
LAGAIVLPDNCLITKNYWWTAGETKSMKNIISFIFHKWKRRSAMPFLYSVECNQSTVDGARVYRVKDAVKGSFYELKTIST